MLDSNTQLHEDEFSEKEYNTVRLHHKNSDSKEIEWHRMLCAWRDENGILCVRYANQDWYHYNEIGDWW